MTEEQLEYLKKHIPEGFILKEIYTDGILCRANLGYRSIPHRLTVFDTVPTIWIDCYMKLDLSNKRNIQYTTDYKFGMDERYKESSDIKSSVDNSLSNLISVFNGDKKEEPEEQTKMIPYYNFEFDENKEETVKRLNENINECNEEIQDFVLLLNKVDGIYTLKSNFGNQEPCKVWFRARDLKALNDFAFKFLDGSRYWEIHYDLKDVNALNHLDFILQTNTSNEKLNKTYVEWLMEKLKEEEVS